VHDLCFPWIYIPSFSLLRFLVRVLIDKSTHIPLFIRLNIYCLKIFSCTCKTTCFQVALRQYGSSKCYPREWQDILRFSIGVKELYKLKQNPSFTRLKLGLSEGNDSVGASSSAHLRTETYPVSETLYFLRFRIPDDGQSPKTQ
jgi:hypothetical protein